jgi:membrane-associated protein
MEYIQPLFHFLLHVDVYLINFVSTYGALTYLLLFAIIFCETGLVVTPFLPGDSLLFAAGSIAANSSDHLSIQLLTVSLLFASILGNKLNYLIGRAIGPHIFTTKSSRLLNKKHLNEAHRFYERHGGKTIIFARFMPIIRTFAPFIAGISQMNIGRFTTYNIVSAVLWIGSLLGAGYYFGSIPLIKNNFTIAIYAIIAISLLPAIIAFLHKKLSKSRQLAGNNS